MLTVHQLSVGNEGASNPWVEGMPLTDWSSVFLALIPVCSSVFGTVFSSLPTPNLPCPWLQADCSVDPALGLFFLSIALLGASAEQSLVYWPA